MKEHESTKPDPAPRGVVFVVDDNALLVEFTASILEADGYSIRRFTDPKVALGAIRDTNPKPAVLITDYEMGELNGLDLILFSHKIHPSLKTILVSGTVDGSITLTHPAKVHHFLGKPYDPAQLRKTVAELMKL